MADDKKLFSADLTAYVRPGTELCLLTVRWAPNGFIVQVQPVKTEERTTENPNGYVEAPKAFHVQLPHKTRKGREPMTLHNESEKA